MILRDVCGLQRDRLFGGFDSRFCRDPAAVLVFQFRRNFGQVRLRSSKFILRLRVIRLLAAVAA